MTKIKWQENLHKAKNSFTMSKYYRYKVNYSFEILTRRRTRCCKCRFPAVFLLVLSGFFDIDDLIMVSVAYEDISWYWWPVMGTNI